MKSRWCPQLSRPIPTLDAILAFGLLSIPSCSGTVSCITGRWSEQLYNWSPCTIVHQDQGTILGILRGTGKPLQDQLVGPAGPFGRICTVGNVLDILSGWSMAQCPAGWSGSWSPSVTICITAQRARNASVIVPELAEIGDNYEFVNQFHPLWSAIIGRRMSISAMQRSSDFS